MRFRSLNEAIQSVTNPQPEFTQEEYIELLESALESIAEELECDVDDLVEVYRTTPARSAVLDREDKKSSRYMKTHGAQGKKTDILKDEDGAMSMKKSSGIDPKKRAKYQNAADRRYRISRLKSASNSSGFDKQGLSNDRRREQRSRKAI